MLVLNGVKKWIVTDMTETDGDIYEVESIVDCRIIHGVRRFRVRWVGYGPEDDTWEEESNLNCDELLQEFWERTKVVKKTALEKKIDDLKKLNPERVIGMFRDKDEIWYVVAVAKGKMARVSSRTLKETCPELAIDFLCPRLEVKLASMFLRNNTKA